MIEIKNSLVKDEKHTSLGIPLREERPYSA